MTRRVAVVGAGVVGTATALALVRGGFQVTLFDPDGPGRGCSFGNATVIGDYGVVPVQTPGIVWRVPGMLFGDNGPLVMQWAYLPKLLPWLWRFLRHASAPEVERIARALAALLGRAVAEMETLVDDAGAGDLLRRAGVLFVHAGERGWRQGAFARDLRRRHGIDVRDIGAGEIRALEPNLTPGLYGKASHIADVFQAVDPYALTLALARRFGERGGRMMAAPVEGFERSGDGIGAVIAGGERHAVEAVVLAAGARSGELLSGIGVSVPLDTERGYHVMFDAPIGLLNGMVTLSEAGFYLAPMPGAVRCAGTVEFAGLEAPANQQRILWLENHARRLVSGLRAKRSDWMGFRPSMPDSLPVLGPAPGLNNLFLNFGHGHLGLTLAGISARITADLMAGRPGLIDLAPYRAGR